MEFKLQQAIEILERTPIVVETMLHGLSENWISNNEGPQTWSAFDIVGHYIHGEKTDWIPRLEIIVGNNFDKNFEPFDRFAQFENSKGKMLDELIDEFKILRKRNLQTLQSTIINEEVLNKTGIHPKFGSVTLRQLLASWVVHDLTHINQLSRIMAKQYEAEIGPWKEFMGVLNR